MTIETETLERSARLARMREAQALRLAEVEARAHKLLVINALAAWRRAEDKARGAAIDSSLARASVRTEQAVSAETKRTRLSLYDHAENNPLLAKVLRELSKAGAL